MVFIVPVVEQTLHGTHGWRWGNKPHDSSCGVRFVATLGANISLGKLKKNILGGAPNPAQGATAPYVSLVRFQLSNKKKRLGYFPAAA